jgi:methylmalonyl-CoA mutase cobalamin-binding subunit
VATVKKVDPAKAEILEKGFAEIQKPGTNIQAKAKEILSKIE